MPDATNAPADLLTQLHEAANDAARYVLHTKPTLVPAAHPPVRFVPHVECPECSGDGASSHRDVLVNGHFRPDHCGSCGDDSRVLGAGDGYASLGVRCPGYAGKPCADGAEARLADGGYSIAGAPEVCDVCASVALGFDDIAQLDALRAS